MDWGELNYQRTRLGVQPSLDCVDAVMKLNKEDGERLIRHMQEDGPNEIASKGLEAGREIIANGGLFSLGKPICVLTSNSTETDRHYEEAGSVGQEMKLHQDKMGLPHYLIEQAE